MSLANRATTPEECRVLEDAGFRRSALESMSIGPYQGHWFHEHWLPEGRGHVGPDEALAILRAHEHELQHRVATADEVQRIQQSGIFVRSSYRETSEGWMHRATGKILTTDRALAYARNASPPPASNAH